MDLGEYEGRIDTDSSSTMDRIEIAKAREGDEMALNGLMDKYKNFVHMKAKPYFIVGAEKDDIVQEGMLGLYKAIQAYDLDQQVTFSAFADLCIKRQIITAIKTSTRQKHIPLNSSISLNKLVYEDESDRTLLDVLDLDVVPDPLETITSKETFDKISKKMQSVLSDFEQDVFMRYLNKESYAQMAVALGTHEKAIDNAIQRIKKKLDKHIVHNNEIEL